MTLKKLSLLSLAALAGMTSHAAWAGRAEAEANLSKLNVPEGFKVEVYAEVKGARQMALGQSTGTVFVGTRDKYVYAVVDKNKDRKADQVVTILDDLKIGNGVAMYQGNLYVAEQNRIAMYSAPGFDLTLPFSEMRQVIYDQLPDKSHHGWRYIDFGPDNKLYVTIGAPCNICDPEQFEATIIRMNPDGSDAEVYAKGIRNSVGIDFQPKTNVLYFTDNNTDMMGDDDPAGEFNAAPKAGMHFGFPYYAGGHSRHPDWKDKQPDQEVTFPVVEFQAHVASLGFKFYTGKMFPQDFNGDAIIAQHGSWNRTEPVGYRLMRVKFDDSHNPVGKEVFIDGWLQDGEAWGRPTDVLQLPDGSLLVSDDYNDVIYRVSYGEKSSAKAATAPVAKSSESVTHTGFAMPESAFTAADGRTFVSEIGEFGKQGDGKISIINRDGSRSVLATGLNDPKGIDMWNNELYVADVDQVAKVDMNGKVTIIAKAADFPGKPVFLNDIEIDGIGNVYVSDSGEDNGDNAGIYRLTQDGNITEIVKDDSGIKRPNGLLMNGANSLYVVDFGTGNLFSVDIATAKTRLLNRGFGSKNSADGIIRDSRGYLYISSWGDGKVWQLVEPSATPQLILDGLQSAADLGLSSDGKQLLIPDMKAGEVISLPLH